MVVKVSLFNGHTYYNLLKVVFLTITQLMLHHEKNSKSILIQIYMQNEMQNPKKYLLHTINKPYEV